MNYIFRGQKVRLKVDKYPETNITRVRLFSLDEAYEIAELTEQIEEDEYKSVRINDPHYSYVKDNFYVQEFISSYNLGEAVGLLAVKQDISYPLYKFNFNVK